MKLLKSPYIIQMIKSMVTLFSTLKIKHNGRLCHLISASRSECTLPFRLIWKPDLSAAAHWVYQNDKVVAVMCSQYRPITQVSACSREGGRKGQLGSSEGLTAWQLSLRGVLWCQRQDIHNCECWCFSQHIVKMCRPLGLNPGGPEVYIQQEKEVERTDESDPN